MLEELLKAGWMSDNMGITESMSILTCSAVSAGEKKIISVFTTTN